MPHAAKAEFPVTILPHLSTQSSPPPSGSATPQQPTRRVPSPQRWLPGSKEGPALAARLQGRPCASFLSSVLPSPLSSEHAPLRGWISPHHMTRMDTQTLTVLSLSYTSGHVYHEQISCLHW